jgi:hypothetical protein
MKKQIQFSLFYLISFAFACKTPTSTPTTAEVQFAGNPAAGLVTLKATGTGNTKESALENAYFVAFNTLFYGGIPEFTALRTPMISSTQNEGTQQKPYLKKFYDNQYFLRFVTNREVTTYQNAPNNRKMKSAQQIFTLNYESLRKDFI